MLIQHSTAQHSTAQHSTAQHSTLRQVTKNIVQVTAFTVSCLVVLPSFVQTADAQTTMDPIDVYGEPIYDPWGDWNGWGDEGQGCQSIGCESYGGDDSGGGGSTANAHSDYCDIVSETISLLSGMRIVGVSGNILSLGGIAGGFGLNTLSAGLIDIDTFFGSGMHAPPVYGDEAAINWNRANINWQPYLANWHTINSSRPTIQNDGAEHIMALYFQSLGIGSGPNNVTPPSELLPNDPDLGLSCN